MMKNKWFHRVDLLRNIWKVWGYDFRGIRSKRIFRRLMYIFVCGLLMIAMVQFYCLISGEEDGTIMEMEELEPLTDKRKPASEDQIMRNIESQMLNLPLVYSLKRASELGKTSDNSGKNLTCVPQYPFVFDLKFNNMFWQTFETSNGAFHLLSAYYDARNLSDIGPAIRIIGMFDKLDPKVKSYCQMWFEGDREPQIVEILEYKYLYTVEWTGPNIIHYPYIISYKIPASHHGRGPPVTVSLVEKACDTATNNLRVIYNKPKVKRGFAICVKDLEVLYDDVSVRLVEWIELVKLLGAEKIFFYPLQAHPNVTKVLDHYVKLDQVVVTPITLPGAQPNIPDLQHLYRKHKWNQKVISEVISLNDCLYKHMFEYEYIAIFDPDEVIMPLNDSTWSDLMKRIKPKALAQFKEPAAAYDSRNVYFFDEFLQPNDSYPGIPRYMHMLQHVKRSQNHTPPEMWIKSFHDTERVVTLFNHYPFSCFGGNCKKYSISTEVAQLQHYRSDCVPELLGNPCNELKKSQVMDPSIWRYKDRLIERVTDTLQILGFLPSNSNLT